MIELREAVSTLPRPFVADLYESEEAYLLVIDVPGVRPAEMGVRITNGTLEITARREADRDGDVIQDERPSTVEIEIPLPRDVAAEDISADLDGGVLELRLPRTETETNIPIEPE